MVWPWECRYEIHQLERMEGGGGGGGVGMDLCLQISLLAGHGNPLYIQHGSYLQSSCTTVNTVVHGD